MKHQKMERVAVGGHIFILILAALVLALSACKEDVEISSSLQSKNNNPISAPKPYWGDIKTKYYTYPGGVQTITSYYKYDPVLKVRRYSNNPGPDAAWETADDPVISYSTYQLALVGNEYKAVGGSNYNNPGADAVWFTADDVESSYWRNFYDGNGNNTASRTYAPGVDGVTRTGDDVFGGQDNLYVNGVWKDIIGYSNSAPSNCFKGTFDANQNVIQTETRGPGADLTCFTADDGPLTGYYVKSYNANNKMILYVAYNGPGADTLWQTSDDVVSTIQTSFYDTAGNRTLIQSQTKGPDGLPGTSDDLITSKYHYTYNTDGDYTYYNREDVGADGTWGTADDTVAHESWRGAY